MLVDNNADVNVLHTAKGQTPLHCACTGSHLSIVEMLLEHPESINSINCKTKGEGVTPLHCLAASSGEDAATIAQLLLRNGAMADVPDATNSSPLLYCCRSGKSAALCKVLIMAGANPLAIGSGRVSAVHLAAAAGNAKMIDLLLQSNADPNGTALVGTLPPLQLAAQRRHFEGVRVGVFFLRFFLYRVPVPILASFPSAFHRNLLACQAPAWPCHHRWQHASLPCSRASPKIEDGVHNLRAIGGWTLSN
jgi:hypothetical protein